MNKLQKFISSPKNTKQGYYVNCFDANLFIRDGFIAAKMPPDYMIADKEKELKLTTKIENLTSIIPMRELSGESYIVLKCVEFEKCIQRKFYNLMPKNAVYKTTAIQESPVYVFVDNSIFALVLPLRRSANV